MATELEKKMRSLEEMFEEKMKSMHANFSVAAAAAKETEHTDGSAKGNDVQNNFSVDPSIDQRPPESEYDPGANVIAEGPGAVAQETQGGNNPSEGPESGASGKVI